MTQKFLPSWRQHGASAIPNEKAGPEKLLQALDTRAYRGLGNVNPVRSFEKTAMRRYREKRSNLFAVHRIPIETTGDDITMKFAPA